MIGIFPAAPAAPEPEREGSAIVLRRPATEAEIQHRSTLIGRGPRRDQDGHLRPSPARVALSEIAEHQYHSGPSCPKG